jgi:hypothetical protein
MKGTVMDEQKRPEPEIMPRVPKTEPRRGSVEVPDVEIPDVEIPDVEIPDVEIPPDKDIPEKQSPPTAEEL